MLVPNPLRRYIFVDRIKSRKKSDIFNWNLLLDQHPQMIAQDAIKMFTTQAERARLRKSLANCSPDWFNADDIWNEGRIALYEILREWVH
jgi:hypothetical protein